MNGPVHTDYNRTTLDEYGYTVYSANGTVSNGTNCYLTFGKYQPVLFDNGTFYNSTDCSQPLYPIETRGGVGMAWAIMMILLLPFTLFCLRKHGRSYLTEKKNFRRFGRKWQWYWLLMLQAVSALAGFFSIDLDRDYIQGGSLTAYGALYCATLPLCLAAAWELTRHWGSFEERKLDDEDPFRFRHDDIRSKVHLFMPIGFYVFGLLCFALTVLRNWNNVKLLGVNIEVLDERWKTGAIFGILAWLQIWGQIVVTRIYYKVPRVPLVIPAVLTCIAALLAFHLTFIFDYKFSPFNVHSSVVLVGVLGYLPSFLLVLIMNLSGLARENEDRVVISLRKEREKLQTAQILHFQEEAKNPVAISAKSSASGSMSFTDSEYSESSEQKQTKFFKFFGTAQAKGHSFLSHNLKYLPFTSKNRFDTQAKKHAGIGGSSAKFAANTTRATRKAARNQARPPPRDIRENWTHKTATGMPAPSK